ncbi:MAG: UvrD-helicase domain-containing protein [Bdellovibrionales bacterium]|nr:UvrD-helicase domain-containing protein [Bdellovibrionales bacterium]
MESYLEQLNTEQRTAVLHQDGPLLIFAGAGSGKTRVLTHRIAHLVLAGGVRPNQILAVTFTNKAAREMKSRLGRLFRDVRPPEWVATFHAISARILRQHAKLLDYSSNFVIYDSGDSLSAIKRVYKRLGIDPKILDPKTVRSRIDRAKNDYKFADSFRKSANFPEPVAEMMAEIYEQYQLELQRSNAMDFGDLLCNVVSLFTLEPSLLESYRNQFQHVLVDEYQDTNRVQYLFVKMLVEDHENLCVVGDDDQSIYAFRGASIENILNFKKDFPAARVVTLEQNYRSTKTILAAAHSIISKNERRQAKQLRTDNAVGSPVVGHKAFDEVEEAEFVVREIASLLKQGLSAKEIAVFYRTNAQSRALEEAFVEQGIPYEIFGGHRFYERKEIKDILGYLRIIANPADNEAFLRIVNTPARGIGAKSIGNLVAYAQKTSQALLPALRMAIADRASFLNGAGGKKYRDFEAIITSLEEAGAKAAATLKTAGSESFDDRMNALSNLIYAVANNSGYLDRLKADDTPEAESRVENIFELMKVAMEFTRSCMNENIPATLSAFLERASLTSDLDQENTASNVDGSAPTPRAPISLMTLHLAKGLEFDVVFLVGMEEGLLPHIRALEDKTQLEEERRLCYVGMTRAKKHLYLTRARTRQTYGRGGWYGGIPSRFIEDLPPRLIDDRGTGFSELLS